MLTDLDSDEYQCAKRILDKFVAGVGDALQKQLLERSKSKCMDFNNLAHVE